MSAPFDGDPYAILGVPRDAPQDAIKEAYRRRAKAIHPDVDGRPDAMAAMVHVNQAYALLSDPVRRRQWDARHAPQPTPWHARRPTSPAGRTTRPTTPPARPGPSRSAPGPTAPPTATDVTALDEARAVRVSSGRYEGMTLGEVAMIDPGHVRWIARRETDRPPLAAAARRVAMYLDALEAEWEAETARSADPAHGVRWAPGGAGADPAADHGRRVAPRRDRMLVFGAATLAALATFAALLLLIAILGG